MSGTRQAPVSSANSPSDLVEDKAGEAKDQLEPDHDDNAGRSAPSPSSAVTAPTPAASTKNKRANEDGTTAGVSEGIGMLLVRD